jgi:hypothetical protein
MSRLYLSGKMRGVKDYNFPAFEEAAALLRSVGHDVFSPAERESLEHLKAHGPGSFAEYMALDLPEVCRRDAVATLPGWEDSHGARIETTVATELGKPVKDFHEFLTCWCDMKLGRITYGDRDFLECPLHGTAYHQDPEALVRNAVGSA